MENTKLSLRKWLWAFHEIGSAKHGISSRELARKLGITLRSAWHLSHRIRATMTDNAQQFKGIVETYLEEYDHKYNTRDMSDVERTTSAMMQIEGRRVRLFKSASGEGDSLFARRVNEKSKTETMRGHGGGRASKRRAQRREQEEQEIEQRRRNRRRGHG